MKNSSLPQHFGLIVLMIGFAALSRLVPHSWNFSPLGGMALFGAAYFTKKYWAFIIPFVGLWMSNLFLNNTVYKAYYPAYEGSFIWFAPGEFWIYLSFALIVVLGMVALKKVNVARLAGCSLGASIIFFLVSNFGTWMSGIMYPKTGAGLMACYTAAIPFSQGTFIGDLVYTTVLFGSFELIRRYYFQPRLA